MIERRTNRTGADLLPYAALIPTSSPSLLRVVVMLLQQQASGLGLERTMGDTRGSHAIGAGIERLTAVPVLVISDDQIARDNEHLFPIIVDERLRTVGPRQKTQKTGVTAAPLGGIEFAGQDLLLNAGRIAGRRFPSFGHIDLIEFTVFLIHGHGVSPPMRPVMKGAGA